MAKARAIVKRRKAVRNIKKITKTMQMIATAKFQKSLKRAVGSKPMAIKVRQLMAELASAAGDIDHPLLREPGRDFPATNRIALVVITSNRGLCGAYNGSVLRAASAFIRAQEAAGKSIDLYLIGKKGYTFFNFQKRNISQRFDAVGDPPRNADSDAIAQSFIDAYSEGKYDSIQVAYMNFISTGSQKAEVQPLLPLSGIMESANRAAQNVAQAETQLKAGALDARQSGATAKVEANTVGTTAYEFSPDARTLLNTILPMTIKVSLYQTLLDATTSEHVARMISMKSATDNADAMAKSLTMQYNRARQSQITTELSEIMGGVEALNK
jgi:F-type H+-transporting ATPase subunit gamma